MNNNFNNTIKDLSKLTSIPYTLLCKLVSNAEDIICHDLNESFYDMDSTTEVDIGIGKLTIYYTGEEVTYYFVPSTSLEQKIIDTVTNRKDPLIAHVEESLKNKVMNRYKDLL